MRRWRRSLVATPPGRDYHITIVCGADIKDFVGYLYETTRDPVTVINAKTRCGRVECGGESAHLIVVSAEPLKAGNHFVDKGTEGIGCCVSHE